MPSPSKNNSSTTFLRQLSPLRRQVEAIDRKILQLLRQRTKLSTQIGEAKRRQGAEVYVPERERELLHRFAQAGDRSLPPGAALAIYREILSCSRAAQQQPPIGLLAAPPARLALAHAARERFGGSDRWHLEPAWDALMTRLLNDELALVLVAGSDLGELFRSPAAFDLFNTRLEISDELPLSIEAPQSWYDLAFMVTLRRATPSVEVDRFLLLIECNSLAITVKTFAETMPTCHVFESSLRQSPRSRARALERRLFYLQFKQALTPSTLQRHLARLLPPATATSLLGAYAGSDFHAGA